MANHLSLARIFSRSTLIDLATGVSNSTFDRIARECAEHDNNQTIESVFDSAYEYLGGHYRNEYYYKNEIICQIVLKGHSKDRVGVLAEFRTGAGKADLVILNGKSWVYEIKSELDNTKRLASQVKSYRTMFEHVFVVTSPIMKEQVSTEVDKSTGIIVLDEDAHFRILQKSIGIKENLDLDVSMRSLRKTEYMNLSRRDLGGIPLVPDTELFSAIAQKAKNALDPERIHQRVVSLLKGRARKGLDWDFVEKLPRSLRAHGVIYKYSKKQKSEIVALLKTSLSAYIMHR